MFSISNKFNTILLLILFLGFPSGSLWSQTFTMSGPSSVYEGTTHGFTLSPTGSISSTMWGIFANSSTNTTITSQSNINAFVNFGNVGTTGTATVAASITDTGFNFHLVTKAVTITAPVPPSNPGNPTVSNNNCGNATLTRSGSPPSGVTWYWQGKTSNGTSTTKGSGSTYLANSGSGTYYIRARDNTTYTWSTSSGSVYVSINNFSAGSINGVQTICYNGDPSTLGNSSSPSGGSGGYSYQWQLSENGGSSWLNLPVTSSTYNPPAGLTTDTWYRRGVTSCSGQTKYTSSIKVTVLSTQVSQPSAPTVTNNCGSTVLTRGTPPSGDTWYWQSNALDTITSNSNISITLNSGTVHYLRAKNTGGCWSTARTINYTIDPGPLWYVDTDGDGFGTSATTTNSCSQPSGYADNNSDINDSDKLITNITPKAYYNDVDGDGFGSGSQVLTASFKLLGYADNNTDPCPNDLGLGDGCPPTGSVLSDENYIYTKTYQDASANTTIENVGYFDGLGRAMQQVAINSSGEVSGSINPNTPSEWSMDWSVGSGGTAFFNQNGSTSENQRINGPNPFGNTSIIWQCGNDTNNNADGGWNTDYFNVDKTKTYRYVVWVRRDQSQNGKTYHGTNNVDNLSGGANSNPYFWSGDLPELGQWYLLVGLVHPDGYSGGDSGVSGVYDLNGNKVLDGNEYKWRSGTATARFRSYLYYSTDATVRQYFYNPVLEVVDGTEVPLPRFFQSTGTSDLVTHVEYDGYGRLEKEHMPFPAVGTSGTIRAEGKGTTESYYAGKFGADMDGNAPNPYSQKLYEASPLSRVLKQSAPGDVWALNPTGEDHSIEFAYMGNEASEVRHYYVTNSLANNTYTPTLQIGTSPDDFYPEATLYKNVTYDENHDGSTTKLHTTEEYTDQRGQVVLKRTYADMDLNEDGDTLDPGETEVPHDTYYVYDDFGNLTYVLPPKVDTSNGVSATELSELCYQYVYDHRNRLVEKKLPGKGWEYIVYNTLDQPILTQDANLDAANQWLFTKYDGFGRVAYTGLLSSGSSRSTLQTAADAETDQFESQQVSATNFESGAVAVYYSNDSYPGTNIDKIYTVNYYGSHVDTDGLSVPSSVLGQTTTSDNSGLPTVSKVRVLGTTDWITTISGYDEKSRPIYSASKNNYLSTTDIVESELDFTGRVVETKTTHTKGANPAIVTTDVFEYDHVGRLKKQTQTIGSQTDVLVENVYDDLGQLVQKKVGGNLQTVDYTYNVRGWLKQINDPNNLGSDLFAFGINYNQTEYGGAPLYNGNIAETAWKTSNDNVLRRYRYAYDALNRLNLAAFNIENNTNPNWYTESNLTYDKNGNLLTLNRNGWQNSGTYTSMDVLDYDYHNSDLSNKLYKVKDTGSSTYGFKDSSVDDQDYWYDSNGNMIQDDNKGITSITYNHLNLPTNIVTSSGNISYVYDAAGTKLKKTVSGGGSVTDYAGNYVYQGGTLQFFSHPEGYVTPDGTGGYDYIYQYKDHLGNVRLSFVDNAGTAEIVEESNYYPFGLKHKGYNQGTSPLGNDVAQKWKFGGMEHDDTFGLETYDFGARNYDPALGRWMNIDPLAELMRRHSPFNYAYNNPIYFIDPDGMLARANGSWGAAGSREESTIQWADPSDTKREQREPVLFEGELAGYNYEEGQSAQDIAADINRSGLANHEVNYLEIVNSNKNIFNKDGSAKNIEAGAWISVGAVLSIDNSIEDLAKVDKQLNELNQEITHMTSQVENLQEEYITDSVSVAVFEKTNMATTSKSMSDHSARIGESFGLYPVILLPMVNESRGDLRFAQKVLNGKIALQKQLLIERDVLLSNINKYR